MNLYSDETKIMIDNIKEKYKSKIIGFTCSCFDLLHAGHIIMLEDSKNHCDVLIVGLQTDPTIDRKEKNKPVETYEERYIQLRAVKYIDEIIKYSTEKDLSDILIELKPDIRILGNDWQGKEYTGWELPIKIYWHIRNHSYSSTSLKQRIMYSMI